MKILVTNDDGIRAEGIHTLARELSKYHDVQVYAPANEMSGVSHSFTFFTPLRAIPMEYDFSAHAITGTPVDCVKLGTFLMGEMPDMIVSGINRGSNLATAVLYSGTVSAAMEGALMQIPSLAVSCDGHGGSMHYETSAKFAVKAIEYMKRHPLPAYTMLNLNVPNLSFDEVKGMKATSMGLCCYSNNYDRRTDPRGAEYYWLDDEPYETHDEQSDLYWHKLGYATLTPVSHDMTSHQYLDDMLQHNLEE